MSTDNDENLTEDQAHALLDILSHHETYQEIRDFRDPKSLIHYGPPFTHEKGQPSTFPSLQTLVAKFLLTLPGLRDVTGEFWHEQCATIITNFEKVELSESYDKGLIGIRKTLATAVSALLEYLVRGTQAGFNEASPDKDRQYDTSNAEDLQDAFRDVMYQSVYGNVVDELVALAAETDKLSEHPPVVQAAHEYVIVNLASFMHYTLILSPKGQQLLTLIDRANKLVPYGMIKQTLRIGNVASMINAMVKVVLAKMSMASVTNWMGLTKTEDDGQNLLQYVISGTLQGDIKDFKSRASTIEKDKEGPSKEQLDAIKSYLQKSQEEHESLREKSISENKSIAYIVLSSASVSTELTPHQDRQIQDYLAAQLSIRDREQIINVLCKSHPDHLTQGVRELVQAYEPIIRHVHNAVDLSATVGDLERFISDMIKLAKVPSDAPRGRISSAKSATPHPVPTVGDFVQLLKKHVGISHRFIHQCAKNGKEVTSWFHEYIANAARQFQRLSSDSSPSPSSSSKSSSSGAGDLAAPLNALFFTLPAEQRKSLLPILDERATYLRNLHEASTTLLRAVISSPHTNHPALADSASSASSRAPSRASSPMPSGSGASSPPPGSDSAATAEIDLGPGAFLARWQDLLDSTLLTPAVSTGGEVRLGGKGSKGGKAVSADTQPVVDALGKQFRELLAERGCSW